MIDTCVEILCGFLLASQKGTEMVKFEKNFHFCPFYINTRALRVISIKSLHSHNLILIFG